jgi:hypothetical protein
MSVTLSVELTDLEYTALAHIAVDPQDWFEGMVKLRCQNTIAHIADNEIKKMIADPNITNIPANKEEIFKTLVDSGEIKSAVEMNEESIKEMMAKLPTAADLIPETPALDGSNDLSM